MSRADTWWSEEPRRSAAEYACELAGDRFWRDPTRRLIGTHPDFPDVAWLLDLDVNTAHALVLSLSRMPEERRESFAEVFFEERGRWPTAIPADPRSLLAAAATVALLVVELAVDELRSERIVDLLVGAAQADDLTQTPETTLAELQKVITRVRFDINLESSDDARAAASLAVAEVLDPAGDVVDVKTVMARAAWAAVEHWETPYVLAFLLQLASIHVLQP